MRAGSFTYLTGEGLRNLGKQKLMTLASVGVLLSCFLMMGLVYLLSCNIGVALAYVEAQNRVLLFTDVGVEGEGLEQIRTELGGFPEIASVEFISKEQTLENYKAKMGEAGDLLERFEAQNPMPDTFALTLHNTDDLSAMVPKLEKIPGICRVSASQAYADVLHGLRSTITYTGLGIVALLLLISLLIVANTVRLTMFARRREINIMKYVGATDNFIRLPFVIEGMTLGLISACLAFAVLWAGYYGVGEWLLGSGGELIMNTAFSFSLVRFWDIAAPLLLFFVAAGMLLGGVISLFSIKRYLRV